MHRVNCQLSAVSCRLALDGTAAGKSFQDHLQAEDVTSYVCWQHCWEMSTSGNKHVLTVSCIIPQQYSQHLHFNKSGNVLHTNRQRHTHTHRTLWLPCRGACYLSLSCLACALDVCLLDKMQFSGHFVYPFLFYWSRQKSNMLALKNSSTWEWNSSAIWPTIICKSDSPAICLVVVLLCIKYVPSQKPHNSAICQVSIDDKCNFLFYFVYVFVAYQRAYANTIFQAMLITFAFCLSFLISKEKLSWMHKKSGKTKWSKSACSTSMVNSSVWTVFNFW